MNDNLDDDDDAIFDILNKIEKNDQCRVRSKDQVWRLKLRKWLIWARVNGGFKWSANHVQA